MNFTEEAYPHLAKQATSNQNMDILDRVAEKKRHLPHAPMLVWRALLTLLPVSGLQT